MKIADDHVQGTLGRACRDLPAQYASGYGLWAPGQPNLGRAKGFVQAHPTSHFTDLVDKEILHVPLPSLLFPSCGISLHPRNREKEMGHSSSEIT